MFAKERISTQNHLKLDLSISEAMGSGKGNKGFKISSVDDANCY